MNWRDVFYALTLAFALLWVFGANDLIRGRDRRGFLLCGVAMLCFMAGITVRLWYK